MIRARCLAAAGKVKVNQANTAQLIVSETENENSNLGGSGFNDSLWFVRRHGQGTAQVTPQHHFNNNMQNYFLGLELQFSGEELSTSNHDSCNYRCFAPLSFRRKTLHMLLFNLTMKRKESIMNRNEKNGLMLGCQRV